MRAASRASTLARSVPALGCLALGCLALGCGSSEGAAGSALAVVSASAAPSGPPAAKAMCDVKSADERVCFEIEDDELAAERERACAGTFSRQASCPRKDITSACRLPDGSVRFGYPPKTLTAQEKACKEVQGAYAAGEVPPPVEGPTLVACEGKYDDACEEETVHTKARLAGVADECRSFGGKFVESGKACGREGARFMCDLKGKRVLVSRAVTSQEAAQRFCTERSGVYVDLAPSPPPSGSAAASASAPIDLDPPPEKADVRIRTQ
ncbi:MAG: hypothetical protein IPM79_01960 [Polyangiaceae bacterium]|nr:hypothetical protein [Polyangiaceae bacterium]